MMNAPVVVDTSVAFKWISHEGEDSVAEATMLLHAHLAHDILLIAPTTLPVEIANGLRYSGLGEVEVLEALVAVDELHLELVEVDTNRLTRATSLAYAHSMTVYDALFLALAEEFGCPLVTADRRTFANISNISTSAEIRLL